MFLEVFLQAAAENQEALTDKYQAGRGDPSARDKAARQGVVVGSQQQQLQGAAFRMFFPWPGKCSFRCGLLSWEGGTLCMVPDPSTGNGIRVGPGGCGGRALHLISSSPSAPPNSLALACVKGHSQPVSKLMETGATEDARDLVRAEEGPSSQQTPCSALQQGRVLWCFYFVAGQDACVLGLPWRTPGHPQTTA